MSRFINEYMEHEAAEFRSLFKKPIKYINKIDDLANRQKKLKLA